ncbi:MucBP domain-containing protein [Streptococcus constellatus]|uniref:MucBP domain-containing protein n=1 Tax=Streptococcus constellatus TaxID=76860 RepID=UPI00068AC587|nr:MucBP domain-containing protein [Streptococcus constellatus]
MFHNSKTKGHGSIRKNKIYGTIGVLTLGTIAILSAHQGVAADEVKATKPTTPTPVAEASDTSLAAQSKAAATEAASSSTAKTVKETTPAASTTTAPAGSTSTSDNTTTSAATKTESATKPATAKAETPATAKPSAQTSTTTDVNVDSSELDKAVNDAKKAGVDVQKGTDINHGTVTTEAEKNQKVAEIKKDYKKQADDIKKVTEAAKEDSAKYKTAKEKYDAELAKYNTAKAIYDTAKAKYDQDKAKYDKDKADYEVKKAQYEFDKAQYEQDLTKYYAAKAKYEKDLADYIVAQAKYEKDLQDYNAALAEWEKNKHKDGYIKQKLAQELVFKNEPNAQLTFPGGDKVYTKEELKRYFYDNIKNKLGSTDPSDGENDFNATNNVSQLSRVMLREGKPLVAQYTNLQNSYFKGKKISKVEYVYTLKDSGTPGLHEIPAFIEKDPTKTIWYMSLYGRNTRINMKAYFYDEDGNKMDMTGALVSFSSLNRGTGASNASKKAANKSTVEKVFNFNGRFLDINGSSIARQYDGGAYSSTNNESKLYGSKYDVGEWDSSNAPYKWYGAIVGQVTSPDIEVEFGSTLRATPWFAFNSDIKANGIPTKPVAPTKPKEPKEPNKPIEPDVPIAPTEPVKPTPPTAPDKPATRKATYHYHTLKYQTTPTPQKKYGDVTVEYKNKDGVTIAPKVTDTPRSEVGTDYDTTDQRRDTITTVDGKKYKLDLKATQGAEKGKVVEGNTNITYFYDLIPDAPQKKYGDVTAEYKNKDGVTIAPKVTDTPRSEVGTDYDTTDQRRDTITTVDGKKYKLDLKATQGAEKGKVVEGNTNITYFYDLIPDAPQKKYGDVTVEYKNKDGVTIAPKVTDTPRSEVGTDYDTTDQRRDTITTVDGKKYKLDLKATQGAEKGKVVEGNTNITYFYDLIPDAPQKKYGDVTVEYKNKDGVTIAPKVTDTPRSEVGTDYDTTDQRRDTITTVDGKKYKLDLKATQGAEKGKVVEGNTNITYFYDLIPDAPQKKYGDVTVEYKNKDGVTIAPKVTDTPRSEVGTDYDTTDQRRDTITTVDGKKYKLDLKATQGAEKGKVVEGNTNITYFYDLIPDAPQKKYGDVTVEYKNKDGVTIAPKVTDTPRSEVGTDYDTTDQRRDTITTVDGKKYKLDLKATQGAEKGKVVEGNTNITYFYDLIPDAPQKKYGDVTVEYKNKDGVTIAPKVTDTPRSEVGTDYDTTDQRRDTITTVDGKKYKLDLKATQGAEKGKVVEGNTNITYFYDLIPDAPQKKYGDVTVEYKNKDGVTIAPKVTDTPRSEVGTDYDTTDQRRDTITTVDGKKYKLDLKATQGAEKGKVVEGNTNITYFYDLIPDAPQKKYGDVTVEYKNKDGVTIAPKVTDTPRSEVGTDYDTTDQRRDTITTVDGKKYKLDLKATQGAEKGKVVEGNTNITYFYDLIPDAPQKKYGDVTVEYKNKDGVTIAPKVTDTPRSEVGTDYDTTDQRRDTITTVDGKKYKLDLKATQGAEKGKVVEGNTNITYFYDLIPDAPQKKYGDVTVEYKNKDGVTIAPKVTDTPRSEVGTDYDTTDQRRDTITTVDGKKYKLDLKATQGAEKGKVVEGNTNITYFYDLIPDAPQKKYGDVTVEYKNKDGVTIAPKVTDTPRSEVGTDYDTTDQRRDTITTVDGKKYKLDLKATQGAEKGKVVEGNTNITYFYDLIPDAPQKKYGDVTVEYKNKDGVTIAPKVTDTPRSEVGTDYDTTDQRRDTITTVDGKKYKLDLKATQGAEKGKVVEGNTNITYFYDLIPDAPQKKYGDVTVEYKNKDGVTIAPKVTDTPRSEVGTDYDTTDQRRDTITTVDGKKYKLDLKATQGAEKGKVVEGNTNITYFYDLIPDAPQKKYGDVTVEYKNKDGVTIAPKVTDTPRSEVGTDYDTTDQRRDTITTVDGKKYKLDLKATQGAEKGKVVEGNTNITYFYDLIPDAPQKKYGDVTVEYKNKDGVTIAPKVTDTPRSEVGTDYDTTDQRRDTITTVDGKKYKLDLKATQGAEKGKVVEGNTNITYFYDLIPDAPQKKYGDVTVEYKNKDGVTIAPKVTDTPRSEVGTDYDTTDQRVM